MCIRDSTDAEGKAKVNGMNILVADEAAPIENAFISVDENGKINVKLPEANKIDINNRILSLIHICIIITFSPLFQEKSRIP